MRYQNALLFDIDGTMLDTDPLHFKAYQILLKDYDRTVTLEYYLDHIMGAPIDVIFEALFPDMPFAERQQLGERKETIFRNLILGPLVAKPGLHALVEWAQKNGWGICAVTNAPRQNAELMLNGLGLFGSMHHLLIGDELVRSKPDPYPYAEGLRRLGVASANAVAFEDSGPGIRSASGAGLYTFGMTGAHGKDALIRNGAADAIADFAAPNLWQKLAELSPMAGALL